MNYFRTWGALFLLALTTSAWAFTFNFGFNFEGGSSRGFVDLLPSLSWSPASKAFGNVSTNVQHSWLFTLINAGNDIAEQVKVSVTGTGFRNYSGNCPTGFFNLSSGRNCTTKVAFKPTSAASFTGYLNYSAPNIAKVAANLTGTGVAGAGDTTPDAFTFTDETGIAINTAKVSNTITVTGIDAASAISVTGDTGYGYKKNGAACTASSGTVVANDTVNACVTSSGSNSTATAATVTIGGVSDTYTVTTVAAPSYLLNDSLDAAGTPSGWSVLGGSPFGFTPAMSGFSYSAKITNAILFRTASFAATSDIYVAAKVELKTGIGANVAKYIELQDAGTTGIARLSWNSQGKLTVKDSGSEVTFGTASLALDTPKYIKLHYIKGSGANGTLTSWDSTDGTTWTKRAEKAGTSTGAADAVYVYCQGDSGGGSVLMNNLRVSTSDINF